MTETNTTTFMSQRSRLTDLKSSWQISRSSTVCLYADFECLTTKTGTVWAKELKTDSKYQYHRPCGFFDH